eukprot:5421966-Heterocapsa_arctica.AAC.1
MVRAQSRETAARSRSGHAQRPAGPPLMRPPVPPAGRQPDLVAKALGAAPVQAKAPSPPMAQSLMTKPGFVPKARSTTPKPVNVNVQRKPSPAVPALNIRLSLIHI